MDQARNATHYADIYSVRDVETGHLTRQVNLNVANVRSHGHVSSPVAFTLAPDLT